MALIINHNMPAMIAARNLGSIYSNLGRSIERLSSGLRINKAADDAAGLAVREMMRADIATTLQGIRNAADAVSMIQTADGALAVIDAKLIRMKELAEQAATGTYNSFQREIINSEFQQMALEIDRIANATNFNGLRLLDGSTLNVNGGAGIRIHFGVNNNDGEDYYYVNIGNVKASSTDGLNVGGDSTNDIWSTGGLPATGAPANCCGGAFDSLTATAITNTAKALTLAYNWDSYAPAVSDDGDSLITPVAMGTHVMGRYTNGSGTTLQELVEAVNQGSQSRVQLTITGAAITAAATSANVLCISPEEAYYYGNANVASGLIAGSAGMDVFKSITNFTANNIATAINSSSVSFWALTTGNDVWVFHKEGGDNNNLSIGFKSTEAANVSKVTFTNMATGDRTSALASLSLGGEHWIEAEAAPELAGGYNLQLNGRNAGEGYDIKVVKGSDATFLGYMTGFAGNTNGLVMNAATSLLQVQDAEDGRGTVRTQETAQQALTSINKAIERKDQVRANLGAMQNRLEATIENLTIQAENLQASESRISDVDVATEMTEYTKNNILAQAAASMLAQANSLSSLALVILNG
jgi:flagellin